MPALPPGVIDTAVTGTLTFQFTVQFRAQFTASPNPVEGLYFDGLHLFGTTLYTRSGGGDFGRTDLGLNTDSAATVEVVLTTGGVDTVLVSGAGAAAGTPALLTGVDCTRTLGPLRLGASYSATGILVYEWYADSATNSVYTIGGTTVETTAGFPLQALNPVAVTYGGIDVGDGATTSVFSMFQVSSLMSQGSAVAGGPFDFTLTNGVYTAKRYLGATNRWTVDLGTIDETGASIAADALYNGSGRTMGSVAYVETLQGLAPASSIQRQVTAAVLTDPWLSAQTVIPYLSDRSFVFEGNAPLTPSGAKTAWTVGTITIASPVNILASTNAWSTLSGTVTIGGTATVPTFLVTAGPARVERTLLSHWRNWNNPIDGLYQSTDAFTATKANAYSTGAATPDIWGWGLYSYLDIDMTTPTVGAPHVLAIAITWAVIGEGGSDNTLETTYSPVTFPDGARSTQRVDLAIPVEYRDIPHYGERVDSIRLVGLQAAGTPYTLHSLTLFADQQAYAKIGGKSYIGPGATLLHGGITLAQDGSFPVSLWGLDTLVGGDADGDGYPDYQGDHQNGVQEENEASLRHLGKAPAMLLTTTALWFPHLNLMEGVTATYSSAAMTAAFTDTFGNVFGPAAADRPADWLVPTLPHVRITKNVTYNVQGQLVVTDISFPGGLAAGALIAYQRVRLGMALEALAITSANVRTAAAVTIKARAYTGGGATPSDTLLATATTDASGFVTLPIRNGTIGGLEFTAYLTET